MTKNLETLYEAAVEQAICPVTGNVPTDHPDLYQSVEFDPSASAENPIMVITGPSTGGKDTLKHAIIKVDSRYTPARTATTRARRVSTDEPEDAYVWMGGWKQEYAEDESAIQAYVDEYGLLEYDVHHGNLYGVPASSLEDASGIPILDVDSSGLLTIRDRLSHSHGIRSALVMPPYMSDLAARLEKTGDRDNIEDRLLDALDSVILMPLVVDLIYVNRQSESFEEKIEATAAHIVHLYEAYRAPASTDMN